MPLNVITLLPCLWGFTVSTSDLGLFKWNDFKTRVREHYDGLFEEFYNRSLVPTCDSTVNSCDINCCFDKDCKITDLEIFNCSKISPVEKSPVMDDALHCYSKQNERLSPVFCYEYENSPFLGDFFPDVEPINREKIGADSKSAQFHFGQVAEPEFEPVVYKYGSALVEDGSSSNVVLPTNILGKGYCSLAPIKYLVNDNSICYSNATIQACGSNVLLNAEFYLRRDGLNLSYPKIKSGKGNTRAKSFFQISSPMSNRTGKNFSSLDESHRVCRNVVTSVNYLIYRQANEIKTITVSVELDDVPLNSLLRQEFRVKFEKYSKPRTNGSVSTGYSLGDPVRVVVPSGERQNHTQGHSDSDNLHLDEHLLTGDGKGCFGTAVQFGYDTSGHCLFTHGEESLCEDLRDEVLQSVIEELNFEGVDNGVGLIVPHLRANVQEFTENPQGNETNESLCYVPQEIRIEIIYEALANRTKRYEILGVNSKLKAGYCSIEYPFCRLQRSIQFTIYRPRSKQSRWSEYAWSPIGSSYSWFLIFDWGLVTHNSRPGLLDESIAFNLLLIIISLLIILRKYY